MSWSVKECYVGRNVSAISCVQAAIVVSPSDKQGTVKDVPRKSDVKDNDIETLTTMLGGLVTNPVWSWGEGVGGAMMGCH